MFNAHEDFNNSRKKKINFRVELHGRKLNLALTKTTIGFQSFWGEILKGMSNILLWLMFSIDGD